MLDEDPSEDHYEGDTMGTRPPFRMSDPRPSTNRSSLCSLLSQTGLDNLQTWARDTSVESCLEYVPSEERLYLSTSKREVDIFKMYSV
jgi:hypothetical protein